MNIKSYQSEILGNLNSKVHQYHIQEEKIEKNQKRMTDLQNSLDQKKEEIKTLETYNDDLKSNVSFYISIL